MIYGEQYLKHASIILVAKVHSPCRFSDGMLQFSALYAIQSRMWPRTARKALQLAVHLTHTFYAKGFSAARTASISWITTLAGLPGSVLSGGPPNVLRRLWSTNHP